MSLLMVFAIAIIISRRRNSLNLQLILVFLVQDTFLPTEKIDLSVIAGSVCEYLSKCFLEKCNNTYITSNRSKISLQNLLEKTSTGSYALYLIKKFVVLFAAGFKGCFIGSASKNLPRIFLLHPYQYIINGCTA